MIQPSVYRELAQACHARASERMEAESRLLAHYVDDHERRCEVARMLGAQLYEGCPPQWDVLLVRLNEVLTTYRAPRS